MNETLFPKRIHIEPTNFCNQKCHFCPRNEMERPQGNMKLELFQKIADDCRGHDVRVWLHFMGEPLLNPALFDMIEYGKRRGIREIGFSTNAAFLNPKNLQRLLDSPLDRLEMSMDALDKDYFFHMRGVDEFETVRANMIEFLRIKKASNRKTPKTTIQFMRTPENEARRAEIVETWKPRLTGDDFIMFIDEMDFAGFERRGSVEAKYSRTPCNWLWKYMVILWNGDVTPCASDYDGRDIMGNAGEQTVEEIYNGEKYSRYRNHHLNHEFGRIANCSGCEVWKTMEFEGHEHPGYTNILGGPVP